MKYLLLLTLIGCSSKYKETKTKFYEGEGFFECSKKVYPRTVHVNCVGEATKEDVDTYLGLTIREEMCYFHNRLGSPVHVESNGIVTQIKFACSRHNEKK